MCREVLQGYSDSYFKFLNIIEKCLVINKNFLFKK